MRVYLDIETIPAQHPEFLACIQLEEQSIAELEAAAVVPPSNYKSGETIEKWWAETGTPKVRAILDSAESRADERYRKTSLDGAFGQIAVIGVAFNDEDPVSIFYADYTAPHAENTLLNRFYSLLAERHSPRDPFQFIGHNVINFDLRFILQRSIINRNKPLECIPFAAKPWDQDKVFDTMTAWAGVGNRISLDKLCKALDIPGKADDIDGSKVWDFIKSGRIAEVAEYCKDDVRKARACHERMIFEATNISVAAPNIAPAPAKISAEPEDDAEITLGKINAALKLVSVSAAQLAEMDFQCRTDRASKMYKSSDLRKICAAIIKHLEGVA